MSEIEKMYENAGIKPYIYCSKPQLDCDARENGNCKQDCEYYSGKRTRITFTAEKQLELIKWLSNFWVHINKVNEQFNISTGGGYVSYYAEDLADAIALYINSKWNNLTEQERTEIADILKG